MGKCSVINCSSKREDKTPGLSFHSFPSDEITKNKWILATGRLNWLPTKSALICSKHFEEFDFIVTSKSKYLLSIAVPTKNVSSIAAAPTFPIVRVVPPKEVLQICRVCMTDTALEPVLKNLERLFLFISGIHTYHRALKADLPLALCNSCWEDFYKCIAFRENAKRANEALLELKRNGKLTIDNIKRLESTEDNTEEVTVKEDDDQEFDTNDVKMEIFKEEMWVGNQCSEEKQKDESTPSYDPVYHTISEESEEDDMFDSRITSTRWSEKEESLGGKSEKNESQEGQNEKDDMSDRKPTRRSEKEGPQEVNEEDLIANEPKDVPKSGKGSRSRYKYIKQNIEKWFKVRILTEEEQREEFDKRKLKERYCMRRFRCVLCYNGFSSEAVYNKHMEKHEECPELPYSCAICNYRYPDKRRLVKHLSLHQKVLYCRSCDYVTDTLSMAILHVHWHRGKTYQCKHCSNVFNLLPTLVNHVRIKHPSDHVCTLCGYSFVGDKGLAAHRKLKHDGQDLTVPETGPLCIECNIRFLNEDALNIHRAVSLKHEDNELRISNDASQPRSLEYKSYGCTSKLDGRRPLRETLRPVDCEKCGITLRSYRQYQMHFLKQHPNETRTQLSHKISPALCDLCGKTFKKPCALRQHMNEHTRAVIYKCEHCEKTFTNRFKFRVHLLIHKSPRYTCPICMTSFNQPSNFNRHLKYVHSNERNIQCPCCEKRFKSGPELKLHNDHVHLRKPRPKRIRTKPKDGTGRIDCKRKKDGNMLNGDDTISN